MGTPTRRCDVVTCATDGRLTANASLCPPESPPPPARLSTRRTRLHLRDQVLPGTEGRTGRSLSWPRGHRRRTSLRLLKAPQRMSPRVFEASCPADVHDDDSGQQQCRADLPRKASPGASPEPDTLLPWPPRIFFRDCVSARAAFERRDREKILFQCIFYRDRG